MVDYDRRGGRCGGSSEFSLAFELSLRGRPVPLDRPGLGQQGRRRNGKDTSILAVSHHRFGKICMRQDFSRSLKSSVGVKPQTHHRRQAVKPSSFGTRILTEKGQKRDQNFHSPVPTGNQSRMIQWRQVTSMFGIKEGSWRGAWRPYQ